MTVEEAQRLLEDTRGKIDDLDRKLVDLLNQRARLAIEHISRAKAALDLPVEQAAREEHVYRNVLDHSHGPIPPDVLKRIFERIIEEMSGLQRARRQSGRP
jgi:chorismate mutase